MTTLGDSLTVAFTADGEVYPDVARLAELTQAGWQRLVASQ